MATPTTLDELRLISEKNNIPLEMLQKEFGIYEYSFSSCQEASDGYHGGFTSNIFNKTNPAGPDITAYYKGWLEISLKEKPDVTVMNFEEALDFIKVCYRHGDQFVLLVDTIEKAIGENPALMSRFLKEGRYHTFYEYNECPLNAMVKRVMQKIDLNYQKQVKETNDKDTLIALRNEANEYGFADYRPFPDLFEKIAIKLVNLTKTIAELSETNTGWPEHRLRRWRELVKKSKDLPQIFPSLKDFLQAANQQDSDRSRRHNSVWYIANTLFGFCKTVSDVDRLYDYTSPYTRVFEELGPHQLFDTEPQELKNALYDNYIATKKGLLLKEFPKTTDLRGIASFASQRLNGTGLDSEINTAWIKETKRRLQQPIPSFIKLYNLAHESLKHEVLKRWNWWGRSQLADAIESKGVGAFDTSLIPMPQKWRGGGDYHIWPKDKEVFSTFAMYLNSVTDITNSGAAQLTWMRYIIKNMRLTSECNGCGCLFDEELQYLIRKMNTSASLDVLWQAYKVMCEELAVYAISQSATRALLLDEILHKDPTAIEKIFSSLTLNDPLYKKYMRLKIEMAV